MSTTNKRSTRKRPLILTLSSDSESEDIVAKPPKKQKIAKSSSKHIEDNNVDEPKRLRKSKPKSKDSSKTTSVSSESSTKSLKRVSIQRKIWTDEELLSELKHVDHKTSKNIVHLFDEGDTIPFICRYRRELIGNLNADEMRDIKETYNQIKNIRARAETIVKDLGKRKLLDDEIQNEVLSAKSLNALDQIFAPFKTASKSSLFERAKALGLQEAAENLIYQDTGVVKLDKYVNTTNDGIDSIEKVKDGVKNIISYLFSKDAEVLELIQNALSRNNNGIKIETTEHTKVTTADGKSSAKEGQSNRVDDPRKYEIYFNFSAYINHIQSHQTLAINRAETFKFVKVKISIPDRIQHDIYQLIEGKYFNAGQFTPERKELLSAALHDAYSKKLKPFMTRQIRSNLTKTAEKESVEIFAKNLKQLLLLHPVKGKKILGIDPGFKNGCKFALISECNDPLETDVIYPHTKKKQLLAYEHRIIDLLKQHKCDLIAIGNGTACRETEAWIADMIRRDLFHSKSVRYCVVSENGASIYSCSDIAKKEFPELDVNLISAVSIARRLSDPLAELVKIEPKHLGVGMYQHDINEKYLMETLSDVVSECVSFVGVDVNTASSTLLRYIAGLNASRAENIVKYRIENGPFKSRAELKKVKSVGAKTYEQCAGFIKIDPLTANLKTKYNILDSTWVHPESYSIAEEIMRKLRLQSSEIGTDAFISRVKKFQQDNLESMETLERTFGVPKERIESIFEALVRELRKDYRDDSNIQPLFKHGILKISDLKVGSTITGAISNKTTFGCFVDIGVEHNGLIHSSQLRGQNPNIGDRVNVNVLSVDQVKRRIQLRLEKINL